MGRRRTQDRSLDWDATIAALSLCILLLPGPCWALQVTPSQGVYTVSNGTEISHVFSCSMDRWEKAGSLDIAVSTTSPLVTLISPSSFTLKKGFLIPVEVIVYSDGNNVTVPVSFVVVSSGSTTTGIIELRGYHTPPTIPTARTEGEREKMSPLRSERVLPFSILYTVNELKVWGIEPPTEPLAPSLVPKDRLKETAVDLRPILSFFLCIVALSSFFLGVRKKRK